MKQCYIKSSYYDDVRVAHLPYYWSIYYSTKPFDVPEELRNLRGKDILIREEYLRILAYNRFLENFKENIPLEQFYIENIYDVDNSYDMKEWNKICPK